MQLLAREITALSVPQNCKSFNVYNYIQAMNVHIINTQGRFNNHISHSLYMILVTELVSWEMDGNGK